MITKIRIAKAIGTLVICVVMMRAQKGKNVKMKDDGLVSKKTPVKVKMKIRDFEVIIYKMIENTAALWYNGHNWVCYALPA